jgi:hypothetical protein
METLEPRQLFNVTGADINLSVRPGQLDGQGRRQTRWKVRCGPSADRRNGSDDEKTCDPFSESPPFQNPTVAGFSSITQ